MHSKSFHGRFSSVDSPAIGRGYEPAYMSDTENSSPITDCSISATLLAGFTFGGGTGLLGGVS